jgi:hypothetical protein
MQNITEFKVPEGKEREFIDFITSNLFKQGFGVLTKSEIDLVFFAAILKFYNGVEHSDYGLSNYLQISQSRVRALKEKVSVKYEVIEFAQAIEYFQDKIQYSRIDDQFIEIPINDIAVRNAIVSLLEQHNILIKGDLNPKAFKLRIEDLFELLLIFDSFLLNGSELSSKHEIFKSFSEGLRMRNDLLKLINYEDVSEVGNFMKLFKEALRKTPVSMGIEFLAGLVPEGYLVSKPVVEMLKTLSNKI